LLAAYERLLPNHRHHRRSANAPTRRKRPPSHHPPQPALFADSGRPGASYGRAPARWRRAPRADRPRALQRRRL